MYYVDSGTVWFHGHPERGGFGHRGQSTGAAIAAKGCAGRATEASDFVVQPSVPAPNEPFSSADNGEWPLAAALS